MVIHNEDMQKHGEKWWIFGKFRSRCGKVWWCFDKVRWGNAANSSRRKGERKFRDDEEQGEKFRRRLHEETEIEEMRMQTKSDYESKERKKLSDDSSEKGTCPKFVLLRFEGTALD